MTPRVIEAYTVPWWPSSGVVPAEVEYIGPWPDGGTGMCVRRFPAADVAESNRQARTFALALEMADGAPVRETDDYWVIGEAA